MEDMRKYINSHASRSVIIGIALISILGVSASKCGSSSIGGYVIDANTGYPIQAALVSLNSQQYSMTDSQGRFSFEAMPEGWHTIYVSYNDEDTEGIDYVPSRWDIYLEEGTNAYKAVSLWPGASIEIEGTIRFVETPIPASWFRFRVQPPGGSTWGDSSSVSEYGLTDSSEALGLDPNLIIVPAYADVAIRVDSRVPDDIRRAFSILDGTDFFNLHQGDRRTVNIEEKCLSLSVESVRQELELDVNLLNRAEDAGFLVKSESRDAEKAFALLSASELAAAEGSYDEAFALLRNAYISVKDAANRLQGLLNVGLQSALFLTFFFAFVALFLTYILAKGGACLEMSLFLKGEHTLVVPLRLLLAPTSYVLIISIFYTFFPGCRLVPSSIRLPASENLVHFPVFSVIASFSFLAASILSLLGSRLVGMKKSEDRSISFGGAVIAAFSISSGNLRRRKLRTALNILCLMVLVFGFIVLTSVSPGYGFVSRSVGPSETPLDALMATNPSVSTFTKFVPLTENFVTEMETHQKVTLVAPKAENFPSFSPISHIYTPSGKNSSVTGVLGIIPGVESEFTRLSASIIKGDYLSENGVDELLVSDSLAEHLDIDAGSSVFVFGRNFTVVGILDDEALGKIREMNGEVFLPSRLQATPGGIYLTQCWSREVVITDLETALALPNVAISRAYVQTENPADLLDLADIIALTREYSVWVSFEDMLYQKFVGAYMEEKGISLLPFLMTLGILIIGSTMFRSVYERRRSIFTLCSIGLNPAHVAALFMAESIIIGFIAGGLGYLLGILGYRTIGLISALEVREKVSAEWSLIALLFSTLTAILATVIPAFRASTVVTPSHLRRWKPKEEEKPRKEGEPWIVELPLKIRPGEADYFCTYIENKLRRLSESESAIERVDKVERYEEEKTDNRLLRRLVFDYVGGETRRQLRTSNELIIERPKEEKFYKARLLSMPDRNFEEAVLKTSKLVRQLIFEWNAQKVAVVTPFESSLNQLYSLIHFYSPEFLYVVAETEVSGKLEPLKRKLELEGIRVPRVSVLRMRSPDLDDHIKMAEDLVSKAGIVCISGDSAAICVALALAATKLKKTMCHVITSDHASRNPFQVSKVVTI